MDKKIRLTVDSRNRVCLTKITALFDHSVGPAFHAYVDNGRIILEPLIEVPLEEAWLFDPENRDILNEIRSGLREGSTISRGSFAQHLEEE